MILTREQLVERAGRLFFKESEFPMNWKEVCELAAKFAEEQVVLYADTTYCETCAERMGIF